MKKKYCSHGFAVCFSPAHYTVYDEEGFSGLDQYSYSVKIIVDQVRIIVGDTEQNSSVSYTFEAGHRNQHRARQILDNILYRATVHNSPFSYSFMQKQDSILLQAADILAWHCNTYIKRTMNGHPLRKDFAALLEIPHQILHLSSHLREGDVSPSVTRIMFDKSPGRSEEAAVEIRKIYRDGF